MERGSFYAYNGDDFDEDCSGMFGYYNHPAAQSITLLAGPKQDDDGIDNQYGVGVYESVNGFGFDDGIIDNERHGLTSYMRFNNGGGVTTDPSFAAQYYTYMKSIWKDTTHLFYGGNGHINNGGNPNVQAMFMFPGDTDPLGFGTGGVPQPPWSEVTVGNSPYDPKGTGSSGPFTFSPGQVQEVDLAFVFGRDYVDTTAAAGVLVMKQRIDAIREMFVNDSTPCGMGLLSNVREPNETTSRTNIKAYPNPTTSSFTISGNYELPTMIELYNITGEKVRSEKVRKHNAVIDVSSLAKGLYLWQLGTARGKLVVQ